MKKTIINHKHRKEVQKYWDTLSLEQRVQSLKDSYGVNFKLPHSITFADMEVAYVNRK